MARLVGFSERTWWKFYDTQNLGVREGENPHHSQVARFFVDNVGDRRKTNLDLSGQLLSGYSFVLMSVWAVAPIDERLSDIGVDFTIGSRLAMPRLTLREW